MIVNTIKYTLVSYLTAAGAQSAARNLFESIARRLSIDERGIAVQAVRAQSLTAFRRLNVLHITITYADTTPDTTIVTSVLHNQLGTSDFGESFAGHAKFEDPN